MIKKEISEKCYILRRNKEYHRCYNRFKNNKIFSNKFNQGVKYLYVENYDTDERN